MAKKKSSSKSKGDFLEEVVGLLHEGPGWTVEKKDRVAVIGSDRQTAEIDVLISGQIAGYAVRIAIECKNWAKKVESAQINEFVGKLDDVGIPRTHGVYVSASGYTKGALRRAVKEGIQPLEITGLSKDRLTSAVERAFRHMVYLIPYVEQVQAFGDKAKDPKVITTLRYVNPSTGRPLYALDHLWKKWFFGECPTGLGLHHLRFDIPQDPALFSEDEERIPKTIFFGLRVSAAVVSAEGKLTDYSLRNAKNQVVEKRRLFLDFGGAEKHTIRVFDTEEKLAAYLQSEASPSMTIGRIRLPRIIYDPLFWPPTPSAILKAREIQQQGRNPTFEEVEGADLSRAWDFLSYPKDLEEIRDDLVDFKIYP